MLKMATVPLVNLLDALLQKSYHDLNVLQELLRNKSDGDRKMEIVKYAQRTRALLIRLLALVKWAGNSSSVQKCSEMSAMLSQQSGLYVNTADQLVELVRSTLLNACAPNFSLAPALDVLSAGTYPRLPACIKDKIIPSPPLTGEERSQAFSLITCAIRHRLLRETVPADMTVSSIADGVICFRVPYEFEMSLSVLSDSPAVPWRLISLKILVSEALPDKPVLLHEHQKLYLHQLVQSRLYSEERPLRDCYECLHSFCLALQLDCLHSQANQLSSDVYGGYMKVEEYVHAHHLKIVYWRPGTSHFMSAFLLDQSRNLLWPKILISIDTQASTPFSTQHHPPLPASSEVRITAGHLSLEAVLKQCIQVRSHALLEDIKQGLKDTSWDNKAELQEEPLCLRVRVPVKYDTKWVVLGVDPRVGNIVATMDPVFTVGSVTSCLQELEKAVTSSQSSLGTHLNKLQCHLFVSHVYETAMQLDLPAHWSLPLINPLSFHSTSLLYLELHPLTYLVVSVGEGLVDQYHLLTLTPTSLAAPQTLQSVEGASPPKIFFTVSSLIELDPEEISLQHLKTVTVKRSGPLLKRKMKESDLVLPSLKRLCVRSEPDFAPLPGLVMARLVLLSMETSLNVAGISHHTTYTEHGSPSANIFSFPGACEGSMHRRLSSCLKSCTVSHSLSTYSCTFVFSPLDLGGQSGQQGDVILRQSIRAPDQKRPAGHDLGQTLVGQWESRVALLGLTLELHQYLEDVHWPLHSLCTISEFTYDQLTIVCGRHELYVTATPTGLSLSFSPDCPHLLVKDSLEAFLRNTRSLPLLLQGVCLTGDVMGTLVEFAHRIPAVSVTATVPSRLQLGYNHSFSLSLSLQANSSVVFTDMRYVKATAASLQVNPLGYLQAFLHSVFSASSADSEDAGDKGPSSVALPTSTKLSLYPTPSPISFPRRTSWPDSVPSPRGFNIPSIPPYPSPAVGSTVSQGGSWNCRLSLDQFNQLLSATPSQPIPPDSCIVGCSLLESFLGSISLLFHALQLVTKHQMMFVQCDRGVYTYRTENVAVLMAMEGAVLKITLKPVRENVWLPSEIESLTELFKKEVVSPPFSLYEVQSFFALLNLPLPLLKSCVQLINHQQKPPSGLTWNFSLCLTIPLGADITGTPFVKGGAAVVYGRGKLLLFLQLERIQDKKSFILPLMFDPKTNMTYVARFQNQYRNSLHPIIDTILKKASAEFASGQIQGHQSLSLFPAVLNLAQTTTLPT